MPFTYELLVPAELHDQGEVRFVEWLLEEIEYFELGTPLALLLAGGHRYELLAQGHGLLFEQIAERGEVVLPGDAIGLAAGEGEKNPYGRPYVIVRIV